MPAQHVNHMEPRGSLIDPVDVEPGDVLEYANPFGVVRILATRSESGRVLFGAYGVSCPPGPLHLLHRPNPEPTRHGAVVYIKAFNAYAVLAAPRRPTPWFVNGMGWHSWGGLCDIDYPTVVSRGVEVPAAGPTVEHVNAAGVVERRPACPPPTRSTP